MSPLVTSRGRRLIGLFKDRVDVPWTNVEFIDDGATAVLPETTESSLLLGRAVLGSLGETDTRIEQAVGCVRRSLDDGARD